MQDNEEPEILYEKTDEIEDIIPLAPEDDDEMSEIICFEDIE